MYTSKKKAKRNPLMLMLNLNAKTYTTHKKRTAKIAILQSGKKNMMLKYKSPCDLSSKRWRRCHYTRGVFLPPLFRRL